MRRSAHTLCNKAQSLSQTPTYTHRQICTNQQSRQSLTTRISTLESQMNANAALVDAAQRHADEARDAQALLIAAVFMYVCMYVCMYVYVYVCVCVHVCTCMYIFMYTYILVCNGM